MIALCSLLLLRGLHYAFSSGCFQAWQYCDYVTNQGLLNKLKAFKVQRAFGQIALFFCASALSIAVTDDINCALA